MRFGYFASLDSLSTTPMTIPTPGPRVLLELYTFGGLPWCRIRKMGEGKVPSLEEEAGGGIRLQNPKEYE